MWTGCKLKHSVQTSSLKQACELPNTQILAPPHSPKSQAMCWGISLRWSERDSISSPSLPAALVCCYSFRLKMPLHHLYSWYMGHRMICGSTLNLPIPPLIPNCTVAHHSPLQSCWSPWNIGSIYDMCAFHLLQNRSRLMPLQEPLSMYRGGGRIHPY